MYMLVLDINQVIIFNIREYNYRCYCINVAKEEANKHNIETLEYVNFDLNDKKGIV